MRYVILALAILLSAAVPTQAQAQSQLSISIGNRGVSLGFVMSTYPTLVRIPGYPVYYDPRVDSNYFFYDGLYWVFWGDNWYSSSWYNGPWDMISPAYVPLFILRIPVRYYRRPPAYFRGWRTDDAPRWGEHWGRDWERQRSGWDNWNRRSVPRAAPLPTYQRNYTGNRYPRQMEQQRSIETRSYRYQPREAVSRQILEQRRRGTESRDRQQQQQRNAEQQRNVQQQQQRNAEQQRNVQQQQQRNAEQQRNVQQQQRRNAEQQRNVQQQQQRNAEQKRNVQQQQEQKARQQQNVQQQQRQKALQQQSVQQQQQRKARQQQTVQEQQRQKALQQQQRRTQPAQKARAADNKGGKGQPADKNKVKKDKNKDNGGHP
ncbi:MAG TPA: hypothetical protein VMV99_11295 [Rhodanobacter sp.]|nr:hypothetical protein [Rhodanobacter sp.]